MRISTIQAFNLDALQQRYVRVAPFNVFNKIVTSAQSAVRAQMTAILLFLITGC